MTVVGQKANSEFAFHISIRNSSEKEEESDEENMKRGRPEVRDGLSERAPEAIRDDEFD
jgi:CRISPR/Cas system CSM-associated protein Csm3 (group 7 of RAMP superfamily)